MNWKQLQKATMGKIVQLQPPARFFDSTDVELPVLNDDWIINSFPAEDQFELLNLRTKTSAILTKDALYNYSDNGPRSAADLEARQFGFLILKAEILVRNGVVSIRPNARPGESVGQRIRPQWTPQVALDVRKVAPLNAKSVTFQYKLWSDDSRIELMIRFITGPDGMIQKEYSGAAGMVEMPLFDDSATVSISVSHPAVKYSISGVGYEF